MRGRRLSLGRVHNERSTGEDISQGGLLTWKAEHSPLAYP